ncbi:hypothetical protein [Rossellomorea marisflavi]|uniref:hypothetical protein n=1 Tax=Rossellomorea marisflavi TaxID=189381 RepID=UPI003FA0F6CC
MKIYAKHENEVCELLQYANMKSSVLIKSPTEGLLKVQKHEIEIVGFKNGKGDTGELKML